MKIIHIKIISKWKKMPSANRPGKFFYYDKGRSVIQSSLSGKWYLSENGKVSVEFDTAQEVMKFAESNVLH